MSNLKCFNNQNPATNGELLLLKKIENNQIIFDVGCRTDSEFLNYVGEVHYFDPVIKFIEILKKKPTKNTNSYFNEFGLSSKTQELEYFPTYQSFYNRTKSCKDDDSSNKKILSVKAGIEYVKEKNIQKVRLLKLDVEGHELDVILGFENLINIVQTIQFEYGGTYIDSGHKLTDIIDYLESKKFTNFSYLTSDGKIPLIDKKDHYQYCNIVCENIKYDL